MKRKRNSLDASRQHLGFERLESRKVLTAVFYQPNSMALCIRGDATDEQVVVSDLDSQTVIVETATGGSWSFDRSSIALIDARLAGGNDQFANNTSLASRVWGQEGDDVLNGGAGVDVMFGGDGNDTLFGNGDADRLIGNGGADTIDGGDGNDYINGLQGNDILRGGNGDDYVHGVDGDDILYGGEGADRLFGGNDSDTLYGENGDDYLYGDRGDDTIYAGFGNDYVNGFTGDDVIFGEHGYDQIYGHDGNDVIEGGDLGDTIRGGNGNDLIYGNGGVDRLAGDAGDDQIRGGSQSDRLFGNSGNDSLFGGGASDADLLYGNGDADRFLLQGADEVVDADVNDAVIIFNNRTSNWNETEIGIVDDAFKSMVDKTGNVLLLKDSTSNDPLNFNKYADLNGASGTNYLQRSSQSTFVNGQWFTTHTYTREIRIAEWDESLAYMNNWYLDTVVHELGHNWDESFELDTIGLGAKVAEFRDLSGWTATNPNSSDYVRSGDGGWWHQTSASFASEYGKTNPFEDWATSWAAYFDATLSSTVAAQLGAKFQVFDSIVAAL